MSFDNRLQHVNEKLFSLGFSLFKPSNGEEGDNFHTFVSHQLVVLTFLECKYIRALSPKQRQDMFVLSKSTEFLSKALRPYVDLLAHCKSASESGVWPVTSVSRTLKSLADSEDGSAEQQALILKLIENIVDLALGFAIVDAAEKEEASDLSPAPLASRLVTSSYVDKVRDEVVLAPEEKEALEKLMLKIIAVFGVPAPDKTAANYLQKLTRIAARCVFLAQRMTLCPKGFTLSDAKAAMQAVPLFNAHATSKGAAPSILEQYTQGLRLLLTLETELLQRFATIVVDEAQSYTAQCAFDPSGHRVGV